MLAPSLSIEQSPTEQSEEILLKALSSRLEREGIILPSDYVQIENFLSSAEANQLLNDILIQEHAFVPAEVIEGNPHNRQALVLCASPAIAEFMINRMQNILPDVITQLNVTPFSISHTEVQITAHQDGNYFRQHRDNSKSDHRKLTYVYYLHRQPKPFSKGELVLYDSEINQGCYVAAKSFKLIEPRHNSIVFFLSRNWHEVLPVSCPSNRFEDSRFTINGWIHRQEAG